MDSDFKVIFPNNIKNIYIGRDDLMKMFTWEDIDSLMDSEITYLLYLEGKDIKTICKIRNMKSSDVERHIIESKIKYRFLEGGDDVVSIIGKLMRYRREERANILSSLDGKKVKEIEKYAIERLFNSNREECAFYIWLLGEIRSNDAVPSIITFLRCKDGNIKRICCSALGKIGDVRAEDALIKCLNDEKPQVREYAIKALEKIKCKGSVGVLKRVVESENKEYVKRAAVRAIEGLTCGEGDY